MDPDSLEAPARETGRHAARGGIERDVLASLVDEGLSIRAIADRVGFSYTTVRHWLRRHGLQTVRGDRLAANLAARGSDGRIVEANCARHGRTPFTRRSDGGGIRCLQCRADAVVARRRRVKQALIAAAGGACILCGYDRTPAALHFHHVDPTTKAFSLADGGLGLSLADAREEAAKCVLLCATCHAEVEAGVATLRPDTADDRS